MTNKNDFNVAIASFILSSTLLVSPICSSCATGADISGMNMSYMKKYGGPEMPVDPRPFDPSSFMKKYGGPEMPVDPRPVIEPVLKYGGPEIIQPIQDVIIPEVYNNLPTKNNGIDIKYTEFESKNTTLRPIMIVYPKDEK